MPDDYSAEIERLQTKISRLKRRIRELEAQRIESSWANHYDNVTGKNSTLRQTSK